MHHQIVWSPGVTLADIEKQVILKALQFYRNDKLTVSNALGLTPRALEKKVEQYENEAVVAQKAAEERQRLHDEYLMRARGIKCENPSGYRPAQ